MSGRDALLRDFRWAPTPASSAAIREAEEKLRLRLSPDHVSVLQEHDGGEGFVGDGSYLAIWDVGELVEANHVLEAHRCVPGVVLIASDGADDVFGYSQSDGGSEYLVYPLVGLAASEGKVLGKSWDSFVEALAAR